MARSAHCDVRRGAAVFVGSDETTIHENSSVLDGFRRLLLQIGGANIASADRAFVARLLRRRSVTRSMSPPSSSARRVARSDNSSSQMHNQGSARTRCATLNSMQRVALLM